MRRRTKRILSIVLSIPLCINTFSVPAYATQGDSVVVNQVVAETEAAEKEVNNEEENSQETANKESSVKEETSSKKEDSAKEETSSKEDDSAKEETSSKKNDSAKEETSSKKKSSANKETSTKEETSAKKTTSTKTANSKSNTADKNYSNYTVDADQFDLSDVKGYPVVKNLPSKMNMDDPAVAIVEKELRNMTVLNEEGDSVALTEEQIRTVLYMYQQYLDQWKSNADVLGVQSPFYLQYNDTKEDGLGVLGEMLVLANKSVEDVRNGSYSYDDLMGMIMNFYYGDQLGVEYYGSIVKEKRDAALKAVKDSDAKTDVQKLLVLNDWLSKINTFDMAYIMNSGKDTPVMTAEDPQEHPHYQDVYKVMYGVYEEQLTQQFHDQIYDGIVAQFRQQFYEKAIWQIVYDSTYQKLIAEGTEEEAAKAGATEAADQFMKDNADAIAKDAPGFVKESFGEEAAASLEKEADNFIKEAETNGVEVDPQNAPGVKMTIEQLTQQQMDQPMEDLGGMSPNEAIPVYADQAAQGLANGILGYWSGNHFGALAEGKSVCMGYAKAFAYLVQCAYPEYYGINGAGTDMTVASNWKEAEDLYYDENGNLDTSKAYNVDLVRITFNAEVSMYGEVQPNFTSDHFWNAVKVDGQWYYVDPCYIDVFTEVMNRQRVETDGYMNHLYFMLSHTSAASMYDGYYSEIKGLYNEVATSKAYEDSWVSRIKSNVFSDSAYFYYLYDSTDLITLSEEYNNSQNNNNYDFEVKDPVYKLVRHAITDQDASDNGDSDYEALIEFNYKENEDAESSVARVYNPEKNAMEENEMLTRLFAQYQEEAEIYPNLNITTVLYNNKLYFNLSNCVLSYDLSSGEVVLEKEYNTVYGKRDKTVVFGGMAFSAVDSAENADFTIENHPITGLSLKEDGQLYVSIATNFAYISGKDPHNSEDQDSYGYEFEESNLNPDYNNYSNDSDYSDEMLEMMGYKRQTNDNDEFMWAANVVEKLSMEHFAGDSHEYGAVEVDSYCDRNAYTEERCTTCGVSKDGSREEIPDSAHDHHYVHFEEEYYTKDDNGNWNTGDCYVCTVCGFAISEPTEPKKNTNMTDEEYEQAKAEYEKEKAIYDAAVESAGHTYVPTDAAWSEDSTSVTFSAIECSSICPDRKNILDCLLEDNTISVSLKDKVTVNAELTGYEGDCVNGVTAVYTATGEAEGYQFTATNSVVREAGQHSYEGEFVWTEITDEDGNPTGEYTVTANLICSICKDEQKDVEAVVTLDEEKSSEPSCEQDGNNYYIATATVKDKDGKEIGSVVDTREDKLPALGHNWSEWKTVKEPTYTEEGLEERVCSRCDKTETRTLDIKPHDHEYEWKVEKEATCTEAGTKTGTCKLCQETITEEIEALGHDWSEWETVKEPTYTENGLAERVCSRCNEKETKELTMKPHDHEYEWEVEKEATCTEAGTKVGTCKFCEETVTEKIEALGHDWGEWVTVKEPTYTEKGLAERVCSRCKEKETKELDVIKALAVSYRTHVQNVGWQPYVSNGEMSGTKGKGLRLEGIRIRLDNNTFGGSIEYRTHVQNIGWQSYVSNDEMSGTSGKSLRLEAIQIRLTGAIAEKYDIYYRTHIQDLGWLGWAVNDGKSGSAGLSKRLEGIEIRLVEKGEAAPGTTENAYITNQKTPKPSVIYTTHVQNIGWQSEVKDGVMAGTRGKSLRLEGIKIRVNGDGLSGGIEYSTHVQNIGWQPYVSNGAMSGTKGKSLRLEGIKIRLTGDLAKKYSVEYRTHVQNLGWQKWVKDNAMSGTSGKSLRLEGIEIRLVKK